MIKKTYEGPPVLILIMLLYRDICCCLEFCCVRYRENLVRSENTHSFLVLIKFFAFKFSGLEFKAVVFAFQTCLATLNDVYN